MANLGGRCMCGAVSWTSTGEILRSLVCYCADCQRATSSPFTAFLAVSPDTLSWSGEIVNYESSPATFRGFCPSCGSRLFFRSDRWPHEVHIHAATLSSPKEYRPTAQVMVRSRVPWLDQLGALPAYEGFQQRPPNQGTAEASDEVVSHRMV
jgi:hypothetical protein